MISPILALNQRLTIKGCPRSIRTALVMGACLQLFSSSGALAQSTTTLRDPLIPGAPTSAIYTTPTPGAAPPIGSGATPIGVNQGMPGNPTLLPWLPNVTSSSSPSNLVRVPANNIDLQNTQLAMPYTNAAVAPPGAFGMLLTPAIPPSPSTPGPDPAPATGQFYTVNGYPTDALVVPVNPNGGLPNSLPTAKRRQNWQTSADYGFGVVKSNTSLLTDFGQKPSKILAPGVQAPQVSQDGPRVVNYDPTTLIPTRQEYGGPFATAQQTPGSTNPIHPFLFGNRTQFMTNGFTYTNATQANY